MEVYADAAGRSVAAICALPDERRQILASEVSTMARAAGQDWRTYLDVMDVVSLEAVHAFDEHWTRPKIANLIRTSDPSDFANDYVVICGELGAVLGEVMRAVRPGLEWLYDSPYWESSLWHAASGTKIPVFHWAIKKMSAYGAQDGLREKVLAGLDSLKSLA
jgi:hypothetical protein